MTSEPALGWGLPVLRGWAAAALVAALVAMLRPSRIALGITLTLLGPLAGLAGLLSGLDGVFTLMAYAGALATAPAAIAIIAFGLRGAVPNAPVARLLRAWPGWALAGLTFVAAGLVFAATHGPPRGASTVAVFAALGVVGIGGPAIFGYAPRSAKG